MVSTKTSCKIDVASKYSYLSQYTIHTYGRSLFASQQGTHGKPGYSVDNTHKACDQPSTNLTLDPNGLVFTLNNSTSSSRVAPPGISPIPFSPYPCSIPCASCVVMFYICQSGSLHCTCHQRLACISSTDVSHSHQTISACSHACTQMYIDRTSSGGKMAFLAPPTRIPSPACTACRRATTALSITLVWLVTAMI